MIAKLSLVGMMELAPAGKEGSGAHVLNYLGGSIYLPAGTIQGSAAVGPIKEAELTGELRRAEYGINFQVRKAALK